LNKLPSILGSHTDPFSPSGLRWQIKNTRAIMPLPPAFCHTITNQLFTQMLTDNLHQGQFFAKLYLGHRENKGNTTALYIVEGRDSSDGIVTH
jgi:hypothetical protein